MVQTQCFIIIIENGFNLNLLCRIKVFNLTNVIWYQNFFQLQLTLYFLIKDQP